MSFPRPNQLAALLAALVLGAALGACGNDRESNPGQDGQAPGVEQGTNPAVQDEEPEPDDGVLDDDRPEEGEDQDDPGTSG
jgi:hypothetical protein